MVRQHPWHSGHESEQTLGSSGGQKSLECLQSIGSQRVGHNLATEQRQQKYFIPGKVKQPHTDSLGITPNRHNLYIFLKKHTRHFSGSTVVKTSMLPMQGAQVQPLVREVDPTCHIARPKHFFLIFKMYKMVYMAWKWKSLSHVQLFATPWTIQSMDFFRPEY